MCPKSNSNHWSLLFGLPSFIDVVLMKHAPPKPIQAIPAIMRAAMSISLWQTMAPMMNRRAPTASTISEFLIFKYASITEKVLTVNTSGCSLLIVI